MIVVQYQVLNKIMYKTAESESLQKIVLSNKYLFLGQRVAAYQFRFYAEQMHAEIIV